MVEAIRMPRALWDEMMQIVDHKLKKGTLDKPVVFAIYTDEHDKHEVVGYRDIATVQVKGDYPKGDYKIAYPGIKAQGFYPPKGTGRWFSGTLVVGDSTDLKERDKHWMIRDGMNFRIKMDRDSLGQLSWNAYHVDFPAAALELR